MVQAMSISGLLSSMIKQTFHEYIPLETTISDSIVATQSGELITVIKIDGVNDVLSNNEMQGRHNDFCTKLRGQFESGSHQLQIVFSYDPDNAVRELEAMTKPSRDACKNIGLDDEILIGSSIEKIARTSAEETCYLILYTTYAGLTGIESKLHKKRVKSAMKDKPFWREGQNVFIETTSIIQRHRSYCEAITEELSNISIHSEQLDAHAAIRSLREAIEPDYVTPEWKPRLVGDKVPLKNTNNDDLASYPRIAEQILTTQPKVEDMNIHVGGRICRPFLMKVPPREIGLFSTLFNRMPVGVPYRLSFHIESGVMDGAGMKIILSNFTSWMMASNKRIRDGWKHLREIQDANVDTIVGWRVGGLTWAKDEDDLELRYAQVVRAFEGWGESKVITDSNDPFESFLATCPMLSKDMLRSSMPAAPLMDLAPTMPLFRPNLPWNYGGLLFTSFDGRAMPMELASSIQTMWNAIIIAPPGYGKSVLMLNMVIAMIVRGGNKSLPKIGIIDIGPTSAGLINMLKFLLPDHMKDLVVRERLQFTEKYSINPMDTYMGKRTPLSIDRDFVVNLICMLCTPDSLATPYPNTKEIVGMAVDSAYRGKSNEEQSKYSEGIDETVDKVISDYDVQIDEDTTWWELVDALFLLDKFDEASSAQRYAVPLISDVARVMIQDPGIRDLYGTDKISGEGVDLLHALSRNLTAAVSEYGIFNKPTIFNVDRKRIVALDLDEVAKSRGKKSAVMYMVARHVLAKTYYFDDEHISEFPEQYRNYYERFYLENKGMAKGMFMDEFHRTEPLTGADASSVIVRSQTKVDQREGRKFNVQVVLASQAYTDFDDEMIGLTSTRYILGSGSEKEIQNISKSLGLNLAATIVIRKHLHGPGPRGSNMLINYKTKKGTFSQAATLTCSSERLWFLSTTTEDQIILKILFNEFPQKDAIKFLAKKFPGGSAKSEIEARLQIQNGDDEYDASSEESKIAAEDFAQGLIRDIEREGFDRAAE